MKIKLAILISILAVMNSNGQNYTLEEATALVHQLKEKDILNENGEKVMMDLLKKPIVRRIQLDPKFRKLPIEPTSRAGILLNLSRLFQTDVSFRLGFIAFLDAYTNLTKGIPPEKLTLEKLDSIEILASELAEKNPALKIEENIPNEGNNFQSGWSAHPDGSGFRDLGKDFISHNRSVIGKTISRTLDDLTDLGLISNNEAEELKGLKEKDRVFREGELIFFAAENALLTLHSEYYKKRKNYISQELIRLHLIDTENKEKFEQDYSTKFPENGYEYLKYFSTKKVIIPGNLKGNTFEQIEFLYQELESFIPHFKPEKITFKILTKSNEFEPNEKYNFIEITFIINEETYTSLQFSDFKTEEQNDGFPPLGVLEQSTFKGVNEWLKNVESDLRLIVASKTYANYKDWEEGKGEVTLLLVNKEQYSFLINNEEFIMFGPVGF
jgi:hypothetical protein